MLSAYSFQAYGSIINSFCSQQYSNAIALPRIPAASRFGISALHIPEESPARAAIGSNLQR